MDPIKRIKKLESSVIDQIAAGEVIERPSQLVKELVENSLDAGATLVELKLDSDLQLIEILDDGKGILKADLPLVFERHSTSKIEKADELFHLSSFGFRGEALSAIGAVSRVAIETRSLSDSVGSHFVYQRGQSLVCEDLEKEQGTKISVSEIFDNIPARKKFLKSKRFELTLVKKVFNSFALLHFDKEFKLSVDGKLLAYYSPGESIEERYQEIFSKKLYRVPLLESEFLKEESFLYLEEPGIESRSFQSLWLFVESRWIQDKTIAASIRDGLNTFLMQGSFPKGLVNLKFKDEFVDVNAHPMKSEVRFQNSGMVYKLLRRSVANWAERAPWAEDAIQNTSSLQEAPELGRSAEAFGRPAGDSSEKTQEGQGFSLQSGPVGAPQKSLEEFRFEAQNYRPKNRVTRQEAFSAYAAQSPKDQQSMQMEEQKVFYNRQRGPVKIPLPQIETLKKEKDDFEPHWSTLMVLGQANLTYIVAQSEDAIFFIDQHAAHERVGYEKLVRSYKENEGQDIQNLLIPLSIDMEDLELDALMGMREELLKMGITLEQSGPNVLTLLSIPQFLREESVVKALKKLAQQFLKQGGGTALDEVFELFFATVSCHSVIRAGHVMSEEEMKLLLVEMDRYKSHFCPHGRPVYKRVSFASLDKDFGRSL